MPARGDVLIVCQRRDPSRTKVDQLSEIESRRRTATTVALATALAAPVTLLTIFASEYRPGSPRNSTQDAAPGGSR